MPKIKKRLTDNKLSRELTYKTVTGILGVLLRFADATGKTDIHELSDYIGSLTVDEFCHFKFNDDEVST